MYIIFLLHLMTGSMQCANENLDENIQIFFFFKFGGLLPEKLPRFLDFTYLCFPLKEYPFFHGNGFEHGYMLWGPGKYNSESRVSLSGPTMNICKKKLKDRKSYRKYTFFCSHYQYISCSRLSKLLADYELSTWDMVCRIINIVGSTDKWTKNWHTGYVS